MHTTNLNLRSVFLWFILPKMIANVFSVIVSACSFLYTSYILCRLTYFLSSHDIHIHSGIGSFNLSLLLFQSNSRFIVIWHLIYIFSKPFSINSRYETTKKIIFIHFRWRYATRCSLESFSGCVVIRSLYSSTLSHGQQSVQTNMLQVAHRTSQQKHL